LEGMDAIFGTNIDTIDLSSFDDISVAALSSLSVVDQLSKLSFLTGDNLEATLETPEQGSDGQRIFVRGFRPVCDAPDIFGSTSVRDNAQAISTYTDEAEVNEQGYIPQRADTRYARG